MKLQYASTLFSEHGMTLRAAFESNAYYLCVKLGENQQRGPNALAYTVLLRISALSGFTLVLNYQTFPSLKGKQLEKFVVGHLWLTIWRLT